MKTYDSGGDLVIVICVPMAKREQKPIFINDNMFGGTFKRNHEGDYHCTELQVKSMLRDQIESTMDMKVIEKMTIDQLDKDTIQSYRNRHSTFKPGHPWGSFERCGIFAENRGSRNGKRQETAPDGGRIINVWGRE